MPLTAAVAVPTTIAGAMPSAPLRVFIAALPLIWVVVSALVRLLRAEPAAAATAPTRATSCDLRKAAKKACTDQEDKSCSRSDDEDAASTFAGSSLHESDVEVDSAGGVSDSEAFNEEPSHCWIPAMVLLSLRPARGPAPPGSLHAACVGASSAAGAASAPERVEARASEDRWESLRPRAHVCQRGPAAKKGLATPTIDALLAEWEKRGQAPSEDRWEALRPGPRACSGGMAASEDRWEALRPRTGLVAPPGLGPSLGDSMAAAPWRRAQTASAPQRTPGALSAVTVAVGLRPGGKI